MNFIYKAQTKVGTLIEGMIEAENKFDAAKKIRDEGNTPVSIKEGNKPKNRGISFLNNLPFLNKVKLSQKIMFARNLAGMLAAGLSLYRALEVLQKQSNNPTMKSVLTGMIAEIDKGGTLSGGMQKYPNVFQSLFVSMVRAGEESGGLPNTLKEISVNLEKSYNLKKKVKGAMMYPSVIMIAIVIVGILMMTFVVPTLAGTFKELNVELPASTQIVISISDFFSNHFLLAVGILISFFSGIVLALRSRRLAPIIDKVILRLPVIGGIAVQINAARTTRTLASLMGAGVEITRAIEITKDVVQNIHYKKVLDEALISVQKGIPISETIKKYPKLYPVMVGEMAEVGEETGELSKMFLDIAEFYESEIEGKTKDLSTIIEPVLMLFIGAAVGFFAVSMLSPLYSIMDSIQ
ncbi:MAG: type II secretion system F family protein [Candidatus Pacebacteria bacterium]|jgi:type IV pilus assembly protein PilC|nr:type II secretion system F family protein [Candidatus Paceibacterota bacterium]MBP9058386.1 type II secretion system F family protein [Candidatus Paceibacterota bacterium]MBP9770250.1 type II secretion system F family protein [Candidatus Paceibacterota bacterium]